MIEVSRTGEERTIVAKNAEETLDIPTRSGGYVAVQGTMTASDMRGKMSKDVPKDRNSSRPGRCLER